SNPSLVGVPATVRVNPGKTTATFNVTHAPVATDTNVTISADLGTYTRTVALLVQSPSVKSLALNPTTVVGGQTSQATVTLTAPAPAGGILVNLSTSNTKARCPSSVLVPGGATQATFTVDSVNVNSQAGSYVRATIGTVTRSALLTLTP
ncbi:MAG: hypothetical protein ACAH95_18595, partial [Fimbriimonas sp.]